MRHVHVGLTSTTPPNACNGRIAHCVEKQRVGASTAPARQLSPSGPHSHRGRLLTL